MKNIKKFSEFSINERSSGMPTEEYKLFGVNSIQDFKMDLLPSLKILLSTDNGIIITDKITDLNLVDNKISFTNNLNKEVAIKFNDFFLLDEDDRVLKYKTKLLIDLYNSLMENRNF
jgi:hypothetical protein